MYGVSIMHDIFKALPVLQTQRLLLRPLRLEDAEDQFNYARHAVVADPGMWAPLATLEENRQDLIATLERYTSGQPAGWGIEHRANRRLIGRCGFIHFRPDHNNAEIGYALAHEYWGQGIISEAGRAVVSFGFTSLRLHRIEATCLSDNAGSRRVLEKLGFQLEGIAREAYLQHRIFKDLCRYALLKCDWSMAV
jgi:ribosomal-protein-alanine N-acetyltransferase